MANGSLYTSTVEFGQWGDVSVSSSCCLCLRRWLEGELM